MRNTDEWLETDGLGGFASGTATGVRTRRYQGILLVATTPPTGRMMLVNGVEAWVIAPGGSRFALTTHLYQPGVQHPDGVSRLSGFSARPWPTWTWRLPDGTRVVGELFATHGAPRVVTLWRVLNAGDRSPAGLRHAEAPDDNDGRSRTERRRGGRLRQGDGAAYTLEVRPLMSGRDYHALQHENSAFRFEPEVNDDLLVWRPYDGIPAIACLTNGVYTHAPAWYRQFLYEAERERGLDDTEDLASPGVLTFDLSRPALCVWQPGDAAPETVGTLERRAEQWKRNERRRRARFESPLAFAADQYLVRRGRGRTLIAGYPWFTDWGRDTFIALRGLCLATGRAAEARDILLEWTDVISEGMLPNRFPDAGGSPEYNSVDGSLWFTVAVRDLLEATAGTRLLTLAQRTRLQDAVVAILEGYSRGTRFGIHADGDGLLAAGERGQQLTWMDARVDGREITPRTGKPVEVQALWLNALHAAAAWDRRWEAPLAAGRQSFLGRFWNEAGGCLFDVVDVDHRAGDNDGSIRPNQILAIGGMPLPLLEGPRARSVVDVVERELWTPMGLRSLSPGAREYVGRYSGGSAARDGAYHQGTAWPWLAAAFVDAWIRVRNGTAAACEEAYARFVTPFDVHRGEAGLGHVSEIADADPPHTPRGCPFQAWSLGELIRARRYCAVATGAPSSTPSARARGGVSASSSR